MHPHKHTSTHAHTPTLMHMHKHTHTCMNTYTCTSTRTHKRTHPHIGASKQGVVSSHADGWQSTLRGGQTCGSWHLPASPASGGTEAPKEGCGCTSTGTHCSRSWQPASSGCGVYTKPWQLRSCQCSVPARIRQVGVGSQAPPFTHAACTRACSPLACMTIQGCVPTLQMK